MGKLGEGVTLIIPSISRKHLAAGLALRRIASEENRERGSARYTRADGEMRVNRKQPLPDYQRDVFHSFNFSSGG